MHCVGCLTKFPDWGCRHRLTNIPRKKKEKNPSKYHWKFRAYGMDCFCGLGLNRSRGQVKVLKNVPNEICGRQPLENLKWYGLPKHTIPFIHTFKHTFHFKFFKVCLPQISLGRFWNTLAHRALDFDGIDSKLDLSKRKIKRLS